MRVLDNEAEDPLEINIVPMIDVIFAILAFFILSTLFLTRAEGLPVNLPNAETAEPQQSADFTVTMQESGQMFLNRDPIQLGQLNSAIEAELSPGQTALITVQADRRIEHGEVIEVMDALRTIEGARLGMATEPRRSDQGDSDQGEAE
ncbi:MAG: biopolymer transporter ExbD [Cyanobacteria bacterium P01_A01_bin.114]